jgi:hypothetical protein
MVCFSAKSTNAKKNEMLEEWDLGLKVRVWRKEGRKATDCNLSAAHLFNDV